MQGWFFSFRKRRRFRCGEKQVCWVQHYILYYQLAHQNDDVDFPQPCPERLCFKSTKHMCRFSFPKNDDTQMVDSQHLDEEVVVTGLNGRVVETEELHFGDGLPSLLDDEDSSNVKCSTNSL